MLNILFIIIPRPKPLFFFYVILQYNLATYFEYFSRFIIIVSNFLQVLKSFTLFMIFLGIVLEVNGYWHFVLMLIFVKLVNFQQYEEAINFMWNWCSTVNSCGSCCWQNGIIDQQSTGTKRISLYSVPNLSVYLTRKNIL